MPVNPLACSELHDLRHSAAMFRHGGANALIAFMPGFNYAMLAGKSLRIKHSLPERQFQMMKRRFSMTNYYNAEPLFSINTIFIYIP